MELLSVLALSGAIFLLAASPGPGVFATLSTAIYSGFSSATILILGIVLGDIIFLLLAIYGLSFIATILGDLFIIIKYIGGAYLIYLGYKIFTSNSHEIDITKESTISKKSSFLSGLFITLANPKVVLFYLTFLPAFMDLHSLSNIDVIYVSLTVALTLGFVLICYAYMSSRARKLFKSKKSVDILNKTSGGVMVTAGSILILKN